MDEDSRPNIKDRTFMFAAEVVRFCDQLDSKRGAVRTLGRQLLRAGTSIGANVEEAQAGQSRADFVSKYNIALKEARETICWLRLLKTTGMCAEAQPETLRNEAEQIARVIGSIIINTKRNTQSLPQLFPCTFSFLLFTFYFLYFFQQPFGSRAIRRVPAAVGKKNVSCSIHQKITARLLNIFLAVVLSSHTLQQ